jgi:hypothetical protein
VGEEQLRFNIIYGLRLLYEDGLRMEFERVLKEILIHDFSLEGVEKGMAECESRFIDYRDLANQIDMGLNITPKNLAEDQFIKVYNGDLIGTLYKIYPVVAHGYMGKVVLKDEQLVLQPV